MKTTPASPSSSTDQTKVELVYEHLRRQIRDMKLAPGTHLQKDQIAAELGVSRAPVSEAIARLAEEMLVDIYPRHGSFVAPIRTEILRECMFIRTALEVEAVRRIAPMADDALLQRLKDNLADQRRALEADELHQLYELDDEFHGILLETTGFRRARHLSLSARVPMDRPRQFASLMKKRAQDTILEHSRIVDAIEFKDPEFAAAAMRSHLSRSSQSLEEMLSRLEPADREDGI